MGKQGDVGRSACEAPQQPDFPFTTSSFRGRCAVGARCVRRLPRCCPHIASACPDRPHSVHVCVLQWHSSRMCAVLPHRPYPARAAFLILDALLHRTCLSLAPTSLKPVVVATCKLKGEKVLPAPSSSQPQSALPLRAVPATGQRAPPELALAPSPTIPSLSKSAAHSASTQSSSAPRAVTAPRLTLIPRSWNTCVCRVP